MSFWLSNILSFVFLSLAFSSPLLSKSSSYTQVAGTKVFTISLDELILSKMKTGRAFDKWAAIDFLALRLDKFANPGEFIAIAIEVPKDAEQAANLIAHDIANLHNGAAVFTNSGTIVAIDSDISFQKIIGHTTHPAIEDESLKTVNDTMIKSVSSHLNGKYIVFFGDKNKASLKKDKQRRALKPKDFAKATMRGSIVASTTALTLTYMNRSTAERLSDNIANLDQYIIHGLSLGGMSAYFYFRNLAQKAIYNTHTTIFSKSLRPLEDKFSVTFRLFLVELFYIGPANLFAFQWGFSPELQTVSQLIWQTLYLSLVFTLTSEQIYPSTFRHQEALESIARESDIPTGKLEATIKKLEDQVDTLTVTYSVFTSVLAAVAISGNELAENLMIGGAVAFVVTQYIVTASLRRLPEDRQLVHINSGVIGSFARAVTVDRKYFVETMHEEIKAIVEKLKDPTKRPKLRDIFSYVEDKVHNGGILLHYDISDFWIRSEKAYHSFLDNLQMQTFRAYVSPSSIMDELRRESRFFMSTCERSVAGLLWPKRMVPFVFR